MAGEPNKMLSLGLAVMSASMGVLLLAALVHLGVGSSLLIGYLSSALYLLGFLGMGCGAFAVFLGSGDGMVKVRAMLVLGAYALAVFLALVARLNHWLIGSDFIYALAVPRLFHHVGLFLVAVLIVPLAELHGMVGGAYHLSKIARGLYILFILLIVEMYLIYQADFWVVEALDRLMVRVTELGVVLAVGIYTAVVWRGVATYKDIFAAPTESPPA
jgi:hypothetical protein